MVIQKYGTAAEFAKIFNPDLQKACASNLEKTFTGDAPTIALLKDTYTEMQVQVWIMAQLMNLNSFSGSKNKMEPHQMLMLCDIILTDYYYLKASELLLFFYQFKAGRFGELYGSVDPLRISNALVEFAEYRRDMLFRIEQKQREEKLRQQKESHEQEAITYEEYLKRKAIRNKSDRHNSKCLHE